MPYNFTGPFIKIFITFCVNINSAIFVFSDELKLNSRSLTPPQYCTILLEIVTKNFFLMARFLEAGDNRIFLNP